MLLGTDVAQRKVDERKSRRLLRGVRDDGLVPRRAPRLYTQKNQSRGAKIRREQFDALAVGALVCVVVRHRVLAVVRHVLVRRGREKLQEADLVAVRLFKICQKLECLTVGELRVSECEVSACLGRGALLAIRFAEALEARLELVVRLEHQLASLLCAANQDRDERYPPDGPCLPSSPLGPLCPGGPIIP
ncbi:hypothetical protein B566_EDAN017030 [Ephemera danica]|nr:hypothetical protein B566_EDAN017030 [Ephemera danica]